MVPTDRGGDITFHGPGQLVAYPDPRRARPLARRGDVRAPPRGGSSSTPSLPSASPPSVSGGAPACGSRDAKIAAIGVRISRGISRHGLALNVSTDLESVRPDRALRHPRRRGDPRWTACSRRLAADARGRGRDGRRVRARVRRAHRRGPRNPSPTLPRSRRSRMPVETAVRAVPAQAAMAEGALPRG